MFSAKAKVCGIIGKPVEHSLSPLLHATISEEMHVDFAYVPFLVESDIKTAIQGAYTLGIVGMNITIPYKTEVLPLLYELDPLAGNIGAVNTLVRIDGGYKGYNTDITGLELSIAHAGITLENQNIVILGAGGAAKAVLFMCARADVSSIILINRSEKKARDLIEEIRLHFPDLDISFIKLESLEEIGGEKKLPASYIVFQSSCVGMYPHVKDCIITNDVFFDRVTFGMDLIYTPYTTCFMKKCKERGKTVINGLDMLLFQGVAAWELWNEKKVSDEIVEKAKVALVKALEERGSL